MKNRIKLNSLQQQLQTQQTNINYYYTKNVRLQSEYDEEGINDSNVFNYLMSGKTKENENHPILINAENIVNN